MPNEKEKTCGSCGKHTWKKGTCLNYCTEHKKIINNINGVCDSFVQFDLKKLENEKKKK